MPSNEFLDSNGHFDISTNADGYGHASITHGMIGSATNSPQFYDIKVYFENSSGDGGTAEESAKTLG